MMAMQASSLEALGRANVGSALITALAHVFDYEFTARRNDVATKQDITDVQTEISTLKSEIKTFRSEIKDEMKDMRHDLELKIASLSSNLSRQLYMTVLGQMGLLLGIAYFFVTHVK